MSALYCERVANTLERRLHGARVADTFECVVNILVICFDLQCVQTHSGFEANLKTFKTVRPGLPSSIRLTVVYNLTV